MSKSSPPPRLRNPRNPQPRCDRNQQLRDSCLAAPQAPWQGSLHRQADTAEARVLGSRSQHTGTPHRHSPQAWYREHCAKSVQQAWQQAWYV